MRELFREFRIARQRSADEHDQRIAQAWWTAVLNNQKKIPKLESLLSRASTQRQTVSEQKAVMQSIAQAYGLTLRKKASKKSKKKEARG